MNKEPVTKSNIENHIECIHRLQPDTTPLFGSLDATGMLRHLRFAFASSIGEPEAEDRSVPLVRFLIWILFFHLFTNWPGGKLKGPASATPQPEHEFEEERRLLLEVMRRFVEKLDQNPDEKHINPGLGQLTLTRWSRVHGIHNQHHFRQFGIIQR